MEYQVDYKTFSKRYPIYPEGVKLSHKALDKYVIIKPDENPMEEAKNWITGLQKMNPDAKYHLLDLSGDETMAIINFSYHE